MPGLRSVSELLVELEEYLDMLVEAQDEARDAVQTLQRMVKLELEWRGVGSVAVPEAPKRPRGRPRKVVSDKLSE